ncbi:uncharacterized protein RJT20DRAFT_129737 [Scheffersomyces xylosifermentans]|uniref:uncharacterized protein n=1 Tax=Scheffersomyces xylosifermentans TaxID=1304137 RepID=UPI00315D7942
MVKSQPQSLRIFDLEGNSPSYNVKSTIVQCTGTDYVFLFGGFDDMDALDSNVYLLNLATNTWEVDDKHNGLYREGHSAVYIGNGNILVFGGIPYDEFPEPVAHRHRPHNTTFRKDSLMMIYNIFDKKWIGPPHFALENAPSSRSRHACCLSADKSKLYVSGGLVKSTPLDDLFCYDLTSGTWQGPIQFVSRFDHYITIQGDKLYSFGGLDKDMNHVKDTITFYSFKNQTIGEISILQKPKRLFPNLDGSDTSQEFESSSKYSPNECERLFVGSGINASIIMDISLPAWSTTSGGMSISYFNLDDFESQDLFNMSNIAMYFAKTSKHNIMNYSWKETFVKEDGTLFLLGTHFSRNLSSNEAAANLTAESIPEGTSNDTMDEMENEEIGIPGKLDSIFEIRLSDLGIPCLRRIPYDKRALYSSIPLSKDFERILLNEEFSDFEILTLANQEDKPKYRESFDLLDLSNPGNFKTIKVHKSILLARWPHFQRLISIGMTETLSNKMLIPEPYTWVKGLIYYLYAGTIDFNTYIKPDYTILDFLGLLILSNLYELPDLRNLVLFQMYKLFDNLLSTFIENDEETISIILKLWQELSFANESIFIVKIVDIIKKNWGVITRSKPFLSLSKEEIVKLCQDSSDDVVSPRAKGNTLSPRSDRASFESVENLSDPPTPVRSTHSPFVIDSPHNQSSFSSLQHLSNVLNDQL